jgi:hypothetical protein
MVDFLLMAWRLITRAEAARGQGTGGILRKTNWDAKGDNISDVPFE